ncbi:hypothetical protein K2173_025815 [Erythroxylum novogranatense]|uniref:Phenolic glucoside malonyltransferase 1-like n=1 Tax=Erythroxylum novogranatense TaxID=1862640 RepID=A0AAV8SHB3_9ROSI|nr:hypothetical protein K2173_025815 [Erythroxylum novogranatense]
MSTQILEVCQVAPADKSPESATEFSLPLTFYDTLWFQFPPVERILFYQTTELNPTHFTSIVVPKLKQSLSQTLLHFLPLAGHLTWPSGSPKPSIIYTPNDTVSLSIAESNADFDFLSSNGVKEAAELRPFIPQLPSSDAVSSPIALQVTTFPDKGFCIAVNSHHAILDGRSTALFVKAWAYICKQMEEKQNPTILPAELTPFLDRTVIKDVAGLETVFLSQWAEVNRSMFGNESDPRSLKLRQDISVPPNVVRSTFQLNRDDIKRLREKVLSQLESVNKEEIDIVNSTTPIHLSSFVLTCAYTLICMLKARQVEGDTRIYFGFTADVRKRVEPPVPNNYFGNCVTSKGFAAEARIFMEENYGLTKTVLRISNAIKELEKGPLDGMEKLLPLFLTVKPRDCISVAGSTQFQVYSCDFGWGRPKKVDITSIDKTGAIALTEASDGLGGVEIGLALKRHETEAFTSLFVKGLA